MQQPIMRMDVGRLGPARASLTPRIGSEPANHTAFLAVVPYG